MNSYRIGSPDLTAIDLAQTVDLLSNHSNRFYNRYYLRGMKKVGARWTGTQSFISIPDFDNAVTAPQWGFRDAFDYYLQSSSRSLLPHIRHSCDIVFAADDPFVDYRCLSDVSLHSSTQIWLSQYGGHLGFLGWAGREHGYFWLDKLIQNWISKKRN
jgi:predicted alpha/beta-fold hydrolase